MKKDGSKRLKAFEEMLTAVQNHYSDTVRQMDKLKSAGREKSATYRQLFTNKMMYQNMLSLYGIYGLIDEEEQ